MAPPSDARAIGARRRWSAALAGVLFAALEPAANAQTDAARATPPSQSPEALERARRNYEFGPEACPFCAITPSFSEAQSGLHWHAHWRSVGTPEYVLTAIFGATALAMELLVEPPSRPAWDTPILFDSAVRDALRVRSADGREAAKTVSDVLSAAAIVQPVLIDNLIVTWGVRRAPRVAWQMFVINAQAYSLTFALNTLSKRLTARARPWARGCEENPASCGSGGAHRAFYSGHAATTATGAGLICAHHTQLALYGNEVLDAGACAVAVLGTLATGTLRISSDNHWASDVLVGHLAGYLSGYLLPTLVYYRAFRLTPDDHPSEPDAPVLAVLPWFDGTALQLKVFSAF